MAEYEYEHEQVAGSDAIVAAGGAAVATGASAAGGASSATSGGQGGSSTATAPRHEQRVDVDKIGRNDPCPCGSGKKYKRCHGT